jgi:hypothetical protein
MASTDRILLKMRSQAAPAASAPQTNLRPFYDSVARMASGFGLDAVPRWFLTDVADGGPDPWGAVYAQVAANACSSALRVDIAPFRWQVFGKFGELSRPP